MAESWTRGVVLLCCVLIPAVLCQTDSAATELPEACSIVDCSLTMYILIGIAAFYFALSVICLVLIFVACCCCKKRKRSKTKVQAQPVYDDNELDDVFLPDLEPITEVTTTTDLDLKLENTNSSGSSSSSDSSDSPSDSENDRTPVIKPLSAKKKQKLRQKQVSGRLETDSPLVHHKPKISPVPPSKVRVPFSEDTTVHEKHEHGHGPVRLPPIKTGQQKLTPRQRRKVAAAALKDGNSGSDSEIRTPDITPFFGHIRKDASEEVASDDGKGTPKMKRVQRLDSQHKPIKGTAPITESALKLEMVKISHKWRHVGTAFSIPHITLNSISIINRNVSETCMLRVCEEWLKMRKNRNWNELIEILRSRAINETELADYLHRYYCYRGGSKDQQTQSDTMDNGIDAEGSLSWID